jgi:hypothetical protein
MVMLQNLWTKELAKKLMKKGKRWRFYKGRN